ncbi:MAG: RNA polymerase sigma-F factor [Eubacteriales bacterium SKADARSKE-1]|nr:RNA polymerase sigma-F factor [Eubacteriales bacterium SKADARSKE-1]
MDSRKNIISKNIGLVHACAKHFKGRGIEYDDLFQAGCIGLIKAVDGFDINRGLKLSTYAVPVILGEIKCLFRDGGTIKVSRSLKELSLKANRAASEFSKKEAREPTINELSEILKVEPALTAQALNASAIPLSLTASEDEGSNQIDIPIESPDEKLSEVIALKEIVNKLEKKDKAIIMLRFFRNQTQTQTAKILGMTQVQVSRREKVILKNMREKLIC